MKRKVTNYLPIYNFGNQCGYLQTIETDGFKAVEVEYYLDEGCRNQGIMSNFFPNYLQDLKNKGFSNITAHVNKSNCASKKILERNGFFKFNEFRDVEIFIRVSGFEGMGMQ